MTYLAFSQRSQDLCSNSNRAVAVFSDLGSHPAPRKDWYMCAHTHQPWKFVEGAGVCIKYLSYLTKKKKKRQFWQAQKLHLSPAALSPLASVARLPRTWTGSYFGPWVIFYFPHRLRSRVRLTLAPAWDMNKTFEICTKFACHVSSWHSGFSQLFDEVAHYWGLLTHRSQILQNI